MTWWWRLTWCGPRQLSSPCGYAFSCNDPPNFLDSSSAWSRCYACRREGIRQGHLQSRHEARCIPEGSLLLTMMQVRLLPDHLPLLGSVAVMSWITKFLSKLVFIKVIACVL
jgi:hypothetical protein